MVSVKHLADNWRNAILRTYRIAQPRIQERRTVESDPRLWEYFLFLNDQVEAVAARDPSLRSEGAAEWANTATL
jgi:hypothetical protein